MLERLEKLGLVQDVSNKEFICKLPPATPFYTGIDPTASSLHLGNLVPLFGALRLAENGLKPIILFGGATSAIGDPSGKSEERPLLDRETIESNTQNISLQVEKIFQSRGVEFQAVDNYHWIQKLDLLSFLRDIGKHFPVSYMVNKEIVKSRIDQVGISYTEFSYMLIQAYDFLHLFQEYGCLLQIGGSDQWGNMTAGLELIRRKLQSQAAAFSFPLLTNAQGKKFGKSENGAVWLDPEKSSPFQMHQFFLNVDDTDVSKLLRIFTFIEADEIETILIEASNNPEARIGQHRLADEVVRIIHGEDQLAVAKKGQSALFRGSATNEELQALVGVVPSLSLSRSALEELIALDLLVELGAVKSRGEGKRLITNGGAYINEVRITTPQQSMQDFQVLEKLLFLVRVGKKSRYLVQITE